MDEQYFRGLFHFPSLVSFLLTAERKKNINSAVFCFKWKREGIMRTIKNIWDNYRQTYYFSPFVSLGLDRRPYFASVLISRQERMKIWESQVYRTSGNLFHVDMFQKLLEFDRRNEAWILFLNFLEDLQCFN